MLSNRDDILGSVTPAVGLLTVSDALQTECTVGHRVTGLHTCRQAVWTWMCIQPYMASCVDLGHTAAEHLQLLAKNVSVVPCHCAKLQT